jgi:hypothetical protein
VQERAASLEDVGHVGAQWLGTRQHDNEKNRNLKNSVTGHGIPLKFLRPEQRVDQIDEQNDRRNPSDDVVHFLIPPNRLLKNRWLDSLSQAVAILIQRITRPPRVDSISSHRFLSNLLKLVAGLGERPGRDEEQDHDDDVENVQHVFPADLTV